MTGATLSASFEGVRTGDHAAQEAWFEYGTSQDNLDKTVYSEDLPYTTDGTFTAEALSLAPNTRYYFKAYMSVWSEKQGKYVVIESEEVGSFTTRAEGQTTNFGYLSCGEIPYVALSGTTANGYESFPAKSEANYQTYRTKWYRYGVLGNSGQMVVSHTFKYNGKQMRNYSMLYDKNKKAALWVAFAMNADAYPWLVDRSDKWVYDPALEQSWQPDLSEAYAESSTYSRGHQVASNDRRTTTYQTRQTTYFSNMTPQLSGFNGGMWASLEGDIQGIGSATSGNDTLYVVTGPVFGSGYGTTKDKSGTVCAVPTQYFKCIMKVHFSGGEAVSAVGAAYLMDHKNSGSVRQEVAIDDIESLTGFDFFANIPENLQTAAEKEKHPTSYFSQKKVATR